MESVLSYVCVLTTEAFQPYSLMTYHGLQTPQPPGSYVGASSVQLRVPEGPRGHGAS